jgi:hypothetical protein
MIKQVPSLKSDCNIAISLNEDREKNIELVKIFLFAIQFPEFDIYMLKHFVRFQFDIWNII